MATSNLGEAIGNSKELTAAAALYDRGQAREEAINAAALARKERADAAQAARDDKKLEEASKWITVNTNAIHPFWQEDAVKASSTFMMKAADEYAKNPAYIRSPKFNQDFNQAMAEIGKLTLNSKAISQDIVAQQHHPGDITFKPGYAEAISSGDPASFRAWFDKNVPSGTYIQGQGIQAKFDMDKWVENIKSNTTPAVAAEQIPVPANMQQRGKVFGRKVYYVPSADMEALALKEWLNNDVAKINYPTFEDFKKAMPQGDVFVSKTDFENQDWAPVTTPVKQFSNVGGLAVGGVGNNGSWVVNRATSLDAAYQMFSPKTKALADIKINDIYNLEAISPTSQGQKSIFVKAFDAKTGDPVKGNVVGARVKSVIHVANPEDFPKGAVDKDGYAIIAFGDETKQAEFQKTVDANTGKVDWNLVQSLNMPIYIAPYDDNKLTIQGQTVSPTDPKGFFLKGSGTQTVTNATGSTGGGAKIPNKKETQYMAPNGYGYSYDALKKAGWSDAEIKKLKTK